MLAQHALLCYHHHIDHHHVDHHYIDLGKNKQLFNQQNCLLSPYHVSSSWMTDFEKKTEVLI
jgi:hypothetical protein